MNIVLFGEQLHIFECMPGVAQAASESFGIGLKLYTRYIHTYIYIYIFEDNYNNGNNSNSSNVLWYGLGRPVITSEIGNWSVFVLLGWRFVFGIIMK